MSFQTSFDASGRYFNVFSRLFPGGLHKSNQGCIDWSYGDLIAYGCHSHIIVYDYRSLEIIQTLSIHKNIVSKVSWRPLSHISQNKGNSDLYVLATGDIGGCVCLINAQDKKLIASTTKFEGQVCQIQWVSFADQTDMFILVHYEPDIFALWSEDNMDLMWNFKYSEPVNSFSIRLSDMSHFVVGSAKRAVIYSDFTHSSPPKDICKEIVVTSLNGEVCLSVPESNSGPTSAPDALLKTPKSILSAATGVFRVIQRRSQERTNSVPREFETQCDIKTVHFTSLAANFVLIHLKCHSVVVFNLDTNQTVAKLDDYSGFETVHYLKKCDAFYLCYSNFFSLFVSHKMFTHERKSYHSFGDTFSMMKQEEPEKDNRLVLTSGHPPSNYATYSYIKVSTADPIRMGRGLTISCLCVSPKTESEIVCISSTGTIFFYYLSFPQIMKKPPARPLAWSSSVSQYVHQISSEEFDVDFSSGSSHSQRDFKCTQRAIIQHLNLNPTCIRVSPPTMSNNNKPYHTYAAVGFSDGSIQLFYLPGGVLKRTFSVFSSPVRHIDWLSYTRFITFSIISGLDKSEISVIDSLTGTVIPLLMSGANRHEALSYIKVSENRNYFILVYNGGPAQLWDSQNLSFLFNLLSINPTMQCTCWGIGDIDFPLDEDTTSSAELSRYDKVNALLETGPSAAKRAFSLENLVVIDSRGQLKKFAVDGAFVKEVYSESFECGMSTVIAMTCKGNVVAFGDADANVCLLDTKTKVSHLYQNKNMQIKSIRFAPGHMNPLLSVLFANSFQIWNSSTFTIIKDSKRVTDVIPIEMNWVTSDMPIVIYADGTMNSIDLNKSSGTQRQLIRNRYHNREFSTLHLNVKNYFALKMILSYYFLTRSVIDKYVIDRLFTSDISIINKESIVSTLQTYFSDVYSNESDDSSFTQNALHVSCVLGDSCDIELWIVADHYTRLYSYGPVVLDSAALEETTINHTYGGLCNGDQLKKFHLWKLLLEKTLMVKRARNSASYCTSRWFVYMKEYGEAIQLLLGVEGDGKESYNYLLRAMVIESFYKKDSVDTSTHLHVASKLIATNKIYEAAEVLLLCEKTLEACSYMVDKNQISLAETISKVRLSKEDLYMFSSHLQRKHGPSLKSDKFRNWYVMYMMSINRFDIAIKAIFEYGRMDLAYMIMDACKRSGINLLKSESSPDSHFTEELQNAITLSFYTFLMSVHINPTKFTETFSQK